MTDINAVCARLGLGVCSIAERQTGGSLHEMWFVQTSTGKYSLKRINHKNIAMLGERLLPIEAAQSYASTQWQLFDDNWLVHEWVDGLCLLPEQCNLEHAYQLGRLVSTVTQNDRHCDAKTPGWHVFDLEKWMDLIEQAIAAKKVWAEHYQQSLPTLKAWGQEINAQQGRFDEPLVMSHRDISPWNVIWLDGKPQLIDWEFVGLIHPDIEAYITMRNFKIVSGDQRVAFEKGLARRFTLSDRLCQTGYLGYCLDWLEFNMERSLMYPDQGGVADEQLMDYLSVLNAETKSI